MFSQEQIGKMMENQTQNSPQMYPARIYDGTAFIPNAGREQSSDNLTTVMTDKNEVLGFQDGTSQQEMEHAINADNNGSISEYKPTFYDKFIREPLKAIGMDAFQPKFISDIKPTPERAFATSMARAATADVFKPTFSDQEAKAYPAQAFAGGLVGTVAAFATGGALLDGMKLSQLTPFAENIIKGGILGGAYKGVSETSNELRDEEHPDLAKIGKAVLHDTLWWGGISGVVGAVAKPVGVASAAGLGYLMAKSDGADEPSALLNGGVLAGFHLLSTHGEQPEVRQMVVENLQKNVGDYILAKNPAVHEIVADRGGQEFVENHAQDAIEQINDMAMNPKDTGIETPEAKAIEQKDKYIPRPAQPFTDGYDPKAMDFLSNFIPAKVIVRLTGTERVRLANLPLDVLEEYKAQHAQTANDIETEKKQINSPLNTEIEKMINEGSPVNPIDEVVKSKTLLSQVMKNITDQVMVKKGEKNDSQGREGVENGIGQETPQGDIETKGEKLTVDQAKEYLGVDANGKGKKISISSTRGKKNPSETIGQESDQTGLEGIKKTTLDVVKNISDKYDLKPVITGGMEGGVHDASLEYSHVKGDKVDLRLEDKLNFTVKSWDQTETRINKKGQEELGYKDPDSNAIFWKEGNHWDVEVREKDTSIKSDEPSNKDDASVTKTKTSGIAKSIEAKAIEQGLTKSGYADLAGYDSSTIKEQSELASKFTIDQIKEIATGREPLPKGMKPATALSIAEDHATMTKDAKLAMELAKSPLATQISEGASALSLSRIRTPDSATAKIRELNKLKEQKTEKAQGGKKPEVIKKQIRKSLEKAIEKAKPSKKDWASFLESIKC